MIKRATNSFASTIVATRIANCIMAWAIGGNLRLP
jgi:hypothetical protein